LLCRYILFITRSEILGDVILFVAAVVIVDVVVVDGGEDAADVLLVAEEFEILLDTVVLVDIMIIA